MAGMGDERQAAAAAVQEVGATPVMFETFGGRDAVSSPRGVSRSYFGGGSSLDYSRDSVIETVSIRVKGLLNWEND
jgi:hypothetical protein